jgi:dienelactone hydrolase
MVRPFFLALVIVASANRTAANAQQRISIPVATRDVRAGRVLHLEAFLYRPTGTGPFPVVVLSHGSAGGDPKASLPAPSLAAYFVERGMVVVVPMRRGRGRSDGASLESEERNCDLAAWQPGLDAAFEDLTGAIDYARQLPGVDSTRVLLVGVSRGGFLSVAYAAEGPRRTAVAGVINFVGAWVAQREDRCPRDFNELRFHAFGAETRLPMLWLYGERDPYNETAAINDYARSFRAAGGKARFVLFPNVPENGHALSSYPAVWRDSVDAYLRALAWRPTATRRIPPRER